MSESIHDFPIRQHYFLEISTRLGSLEMVIHNVIKSAKIRGIVTSEVIDESWAFNRFEYTFAGMTPTLQHTEGIAVFQL